MILKDFECRRCGSVAEQSVDSCCERAMIPCAKCGKKTDHISVCNGGTKRHLNFNRFDLVHNPHYYLSVEGVRAGYPDAAAVGTQNESSRMSPVTHWKTKENIQSMDRFSSEVRAEKRKERSYNRLKALGRQPVSIAMGQPLSRRGA